jgi:2-methylcitrate dehydratase PrpD
VATAVALVQHSAWPNDFEHWDDPEVRRLRHLIDVEVDPEIESVYPDRNGCRIMVELENGKTYEGYTPYAKGEPELAMTESELKRKFDVLTRDLFSAERADEIFALCMSLENVEDVGALMALTVAQ